MLRRTKHGAAESGDKSREAQVEAQMERISNGDEPVPGFEFLIEALRSSSRRTRNQAALAIGPFGDKRSIEPLLHAREHDEYSWVRHRAAIALAHLGYEGAFDMLLADLRYEDDPIYEEGLMSRSAASALRNLYGGRGIEALRDALGGKALPHGRAR